ncbi:MAG: type II secretion system protein [Candidatus Saganbacteria bacterium]|nr:type II secretion system protein [Candidatus Saganbacteria bacterium]
MFKRRGFTLIELLIVMAVIAVLIGIAIPSFRGMQQEAKTAKAGGDLRVLKLAVEAYNAKHNTLPASLGILTAESNAVISVEPTDAFSTVAYLYATEGGTTPRYYVIWSIGPNASATACTVTSAGVVTAGEANQIGVTNGTPPNSNWK